MTKLAKKHFLFLQGPHGSFFKRLGKQLESMGHEVYRVNFNAGDWFDWPTLVSYRGSISKWSKWILTYAKLKSITDLVLYGDCRPHHIKAIKLLTKLNVKIHVFEEGYLRPNWITYERDGVNGYSKIKNKIKEIIFCKKYDYIPIEAIHIKNNMFYQLKYCIIHHFFRWLGFVIFPYYRSHRKLNSCYEALIWIKRYFKLQLGKKNMVSKIDRLINNKTLYYLFIMQLSNDYQIRQHSIFKNMKEVLVKLIHSFAANSNLQHRLVIKNHPLDNGQKNYQKFIEKLSDKLNVRDRITFLDSGSLPLLIDHSKGVITVNSTGGLRAIHHQKPVKILGNAIYDDEQLVNVCSLDDFWINNHKPKRYAYRRFENYLLSDNQINGSFYDPKGITILLPLIAKRIVEN